MAGRTNPNFMNGVPELLILRLLAEREMYGYELVRAIRDETAQAISVGEGVVYPVLHALEYDGYLASREATTNGRSRVYYRLTAKGKRRMRETVTDWKRITQAITTVLGERPHADQTI